MLKESEEIDMDDFAERCRIALEKSYGFKVPLPKSLGQKRKTQH